MATLVGLAVGIDVNQGYSLQERQFQLKILREKKGLTQRQIHEETGLSITTISNIENGHRGSVEQGTIEKLADALGVKPAAFLR